MKLHLLAQQVTIGGTKLTGPLDGKNIIGKQIENLGDVINILIPFVMSFAGIVLFLVLVWGGIDIMMAQGSPDKIKSGRGKITAGVIGFVLLMLSYLITKLISFIFGVGQGAL